VKLLRRSIIALFCGDEEGQTLVEYLIVVGACALVGIAGFSRYGQIVKKDLAANAKHIEGEGLPSTEGILGSLGADYNELPGWCVKPNYCFGKGTPVQTETGDRPIESVRIGDRVWARDVKTGAIALRPVVNTYRTLDTPVVDLELSASRPDASRTSAGHGAVEQLAVTRGHLFWVEGTGWVRADSLAARPLWSTEAQLGATLIREQPEPTTVYNLEVSEFHSYFVGHSHVLVHNGDPGSCFPDDTTNSPTANQPRPSDYCPAATPYKSSSGDSPGLCCKDAQLTQCDCAAQINKTGHTLQADFQIGGEQVDIEAVPGACSSDTDSCSSSATAVDVKDAAIQDELQKKAFTSMCGGSSSAIKPGAFLTAQQNKPTWTDLSQAAKDYYAAFDQYCAVLSGKLEGQKGNTAALHLGRDPDVTKAENALLDMYKQLSPDEQTHSNQITNTGGNAYHTEPKAIAYLESWRTKGGKSLTGGTLNIRGTASPCAKCNNDLAAFADEYDVTITYCFDAIYPSGPARTNTEFFAPGSKPAACSVAYQGCVTYSETGALSFEPQPGQKPLCAKGANTCAKQ